MKETWLDGNRAAPFRGKPLAAMLAWAQASSDAGVEGGRRRDADLLRRARAVVAAGFGVSLEGEDRYEVVFTSGSEESTTHVITSAVAAFVKRTRMVADVIIGGVETSATAATAAVARLASEGRATPTKLPVRRCGDPRGAGTHEPTVVGAAVRDNTCLVTLQVAHESTGAINNLRKIREAVGAAVPIHVDASLLFGRTRLSVADVGLDAVSADFRRIGGPPGIGVLLLRRRFVEGYKLRPHVLGRGAQPGLRGGLLPPGVLAGALAAFRSLATPERQKKRARKLMALREKLKRMLAARFPVAPLESYAPRGEVQLVFLSPHGPDAACVLPGTLLFALGHRRSVNRKPVVAELGRRGFRCHAPTDTELARLGVKDTLFGGTLGVGLGAGTTESDLAAFVAALGEAAALGVGAPPAPRARPPTPSFAPTT